MDQSTLEHVVPHASDEAPPAAAAAVVDLDRPLATRPHVVDPRDPRARLARQYHRLPR